MMETTPLSKFDLEGYAAVAETYLTLWSSGDYAQNRADARLIQQSAKRACRALKRFSARNAVGRPRTLVMTGLYAELSGRPGKSRQLWGQAATIGETLAMPYERALANMHLGRTLPQGHADKAKYLDNAARMFSAMGALYDLAQVKALIDPPGGPGR
jgi:hypothetical protein